MQTLTIEFNNTHMIVMMVIFINLLLEKEMPIETVRDVDHSITTNKQDKSL